jgi:acyl-CoA synthetase (AMP-forming)/AMP-acid ligase II
MTGTRHGADTWLDVLGGAARRRPEQVAFTFLPDGEGVGEDLTLGELDRRARAVGAHLQRLGMAGRRVVLWYPSGLDYLGAFFGCLYAGAVAVPAYPPTRRRRSLERVRAIVADAAPSCALTTAAVRDRLPAGTTVGGRPPIATDELEPALSRDWERPQVHPGTVAFLQYTSGSTGSPRGVVLTHANLLANSAMIGATFGTTERTRAVSWLPMYHDMGLIGSVLHVLDHGGHTTLMSPVAFVQNPVRWLRAIDRGRATAAGAPNFAFDLCVDRIGPQQRAGLDLSSWELAFNGAEPIRPATMARFAEAFAPSGFRAEALTPCYGLAEATLIVAGRRVGTGATADGERVSCGHRVPGTRVEIVDPATRTPCPPGGTGEIWVHGRRWGRATGTGPSRALTPSGPPWPGPTGRTSCAPATWGTCATASCTWPAGRRTW